LQRDRTAIDRRSIPTADLTRIAASGQALQKSGMLKALAFQFCGSSMIDDHTTLAGPDLAQSQALLITQQRCLLRTIHAPCNPAMCSKPTSCEHIKFADEYFV
jgi:hypothetical protein